MVQRDPTTDLIGENFILSSYNIQSYLGNNLDLRNSHGILQTPGEFRKIETRSVYSMVTFC